MANTLDIPERTLAQISAATNSINVVGGTDGRESVYQPLVCRITDHTDNDASETGTDTEKMAIFKSQRHGEPWIKDANVLEHLVCKGTAGSGLTLTTTVASGVLATLTIVAGGTGYAKGDYLTVTGGTIDATVMVTAVAAGVVTAVALLDGGTVYTAGTGQATSGLIPTDVSILYPSYDYSTFE